MYEHKLNYDKLKEEYIDSFSKLELKALDNSLFDSTDFKQNLVELLKGELTKIDQYFCDLFENYEDEDLVGHKFYDFYHRYFSNDIAKKIVEDINNGNSSVEKAFIIYDEYGYKIIPERYLPEDMKSRNRECNTWGEDCVFPIIIDKNITNEISDSTISLVKLSSLKFYNSEEDYIGNVLREDLSDNTINDKNEEANKYFMEVVIDLSNQNGNNLENEVNMIKSSSRPKVHCLKKH